MTSDEIGRSLTYVEDGALVIETDVYNGDKLAERFALGADPDTLEVTIRLKDGNRRPWLEYQRVFRRADRRSEVGISPFHELALNAVEGRPTPVRRERIRALRVRRVPSAARCLRRCLPRAV